jgi:hypothetical protein
MKDCISVNKTDHTQQVNSFQTSGLTHRTLSKTAATILVHGFGNLIS